MSLIHLNFSYILFYHIALMSSNDNGLTSQKLEHNESAPTPTQNATLSLSSLAIHADDVLNASTDVAPPMHVSTTFRYTSDYKNLQPWNNEVRTPNFLI